MREINEKERESNEPAFVKIVFRKAGFYVGDCNNRGKRAKYFSELNLKYDFSLDLSTKTIKKAIMGLE